MNYIFLAEGFEEMEAVVTYDLLSRANLPVKWVSVSNEWYVRGAHGIEVKADVLFAQSSYEDADSLILPGGMQGVENLWNEKKLQTLLQTQFHKGKLIAAICAAPIILGRLGLLKGMTATCYPGLEKELVGAMLSTDKAVVCNPIITSKGPYTATDFALKIVEYLQGKTSSERVSKQILYS